MEVIHISNSMELGEYIMLNPDFTQELEGKFLLKFLNERICLEIRNCICEWLNFHIYENKITSFEGIEVVASINKVVLKGKVYGKFN